MTPSLWRAAWLLARKDLLLELRSRELALSMGLFAAGSLVLLHEAVPGDASPRLAAGLLWVVVLLMALLALNRTFAAERDEELLDGLLLAPIDRAAIWAGKAIVVALLLAAVEIVAVPIFWLFYLAGTHQRTPSFLLLLAALVLADVGLAGVGSLIASLASATRQSEVLLPVLTIPVALPLALSAIAVTDASAKGAGVTRPLVLLVLYDVATGVLCFGAYEHVVTE